MNDAEAIVVRDVTLTRNGHPVLDHVSIRVEERDFYAIIGPNGGGKTTLLKIILGVLKPDSGEVQIFGGPAEENRNLVGYVPQFRTFDFHYPITVGEMVISGRMGHVTGIWKRYSDADRDKAEAMIGMTGLFGLEHRQVRDLSGGEQQRAIIARALVGDPRILLLDEPTVYVDTPSATQFYELLDDLKKKMTIILVSHDIGVISTHVTKIACLNHSMYAHDTKEITDDMLAAAYHCPVDLIAHGVPHRVLRSHDGEV
jgi:ABC-type Mn/Zn transport systems, ATPase component